MSDDRNEEIQKEEVKAHKEEIREISRISTLALVAFIGGLLGIIGGWISVRSADPANIHLIAGGYSAITVGSILITIGSATARDDAKLMENGLRRHQILVQLIRQQHAEIMEFLAENHRDNQRRIAQLEQAWQREADTLAEVLRDELRAKRRDNGA